MLIVSDPSVNEGYCALSYSLSQFGDVEHDSVTETGFALIMAGIPYVQEFDKDTTNGI